MHVDLKTRARTGKAWAFEHAFPLWWVRGFDRSAGIFHESLNQNGAPTSAPRRVRVQARQTIVYARAGRMGWDGPWREAVRAGLAVLLDKGLRPDGAPVHTLAPDGTIADPRPDLYDLAFTLLAFAEASVALKEPALLSHADRSLVWLDEKWALPQGGYAEGEVATAPPRRQNPHMHLFEALQALYEASGDPAHLARAQRLYDLAMTHLFDRQSGAILEYFEDDWRPLTASDNQAIEPGHQFEWSWLLDRWRELNADAPAGAAELARRLRSFGERNGVATNTGAVFDALSIDGAPRVQTSRLWPHTERLKAHALAFAYDGDLDTASAAASAFDTLMRYCETPMPGLWRDRMTADGAFVDEPAPASSFYHIVMALFELDRTVRTVEKTATLSDPMPALTPRQARS